MSNKILVTIKVPMIEDEFDVFIPVYKYAKSAIGLVVKSVNELSEGHYPIKDNAVILKDNGDVLVQNLTIKENNIKNGDRLILL